MMSRTSSRSRGFLSLLASLSFTALVVAISASWSSLKASAYLAQPSYSTGGAALQQRFSQGGHRRRLSHRSSSSSSSPLSEFVLFSSTTSNDDDDDDDLNNLEPSLQAAAVKEKLLQAISHFRIVKERDGGQASIGWGVKGKELNQTSRAPQKTDFYAISTELGQAANVIWQICTTELATLSPCFEPTAFLGNKQLGPTKSPLHGAWKLLFTTAADATFDNKNSTQRGQAKVQNVVDASRGRITNVIDFCTKPDGTEPVLKQLNVIIRAKATSKTRVDLQFRYAKIVLWTKFLSFSRHRRRRLLSLYIPVPATFITRLIVLLGRLFRRKGGFKTPPVPYFEVLYLDKDLRIHKTGEDNLFVQARESWKDALPLLDV